MFLFTAFTFLNGQLWKGKRSYACNLDYENCFFTTTGINTYFVLDPGSWIVLEGIEGKDTLRLEQKVLNETKTIFDIETRIVEQREIKNGSVTKISKSYFAFCKKNGSIYYFGKDVFDCKEGKVSDSIGSWSAGEKNKPGVMMPGLALPGARYYRRIVTDVAMDRAEIISKTDVVNTPAGNFTDCLKIKETNALKKCKKKYMLYAPGIGIVKDGNMLLVEYGFVK